MRTVNLMAGLALLGGVTAALPNLEDPAHVRVVHLIGYTYEAADIVARRGDTLRFVQKSALPHNVEFTGTPPGAALGTAEVGPYVIAEGDTYDLVLDTRFVPGTYSFHCTPHQSLGMKGTLVVQ